jgi:ribosomal protein L16/L10AE
MKEGKEEERKERKEKNRKPKKSTQQDGGLTNSEEDMHLEGEKRKRVKEKKIESQRNLQGVLVG